MRHWTESITAIFRGSRHAGASLAAANAPRSQGEMVALPLAEDQAIVARRRVGVSAIVLGLVLVVMGIAFGLRGPPASSSFDPVVLGAIVVARAMAGLGMLAFGMWLLRLGERLLTEKS